MEGCVSAPIREPRSYLGGLNQIALGDALHKWKGRCRMGVTSCVAARVRLRAGVVLRQSPAGRLGVAPRHGILGGFRIVESGAQGSGAPT
jgi:hypothetical protein